MAISFQKYINIISGVAAGSVVPVRNLVGRIFTVNPLVPTGTVITFIGASTIVLDEIGAYFGISSEEYARAVFYFSFVSKTLTQPNILSFSRWTNASVAPHIFGGKITDALAALQLITNGSFTLQMGNSNNIGSLDFSAITSFADAAAVIQTAIRTKTGTQWTAAGVAYDSSRGGFNLVGGSAVAAIVSVSAGVGGTDISSIMGWLPESINGSINAIWSNGALIETITQTITDSINATNDFGSFIFTTTAGLNLAQIIEAATINAAQNVAFQFYIPVDSQTDAATYRTALAAIGGNGVILSPTSSPWLGQFPEMAPMAAMAATDYTATNAVINYMFQIFSALTPSVSDTSTSDVLDALNTNYYGVTQEAGQQIAFFQRGVLNGPATSPLFMNTYANEQWLRSAMGAAIMTLLLSINKVSANPQGISQMLATQQPIIDQALLNGTISMGNDLTAAQQLAITNITGDPKAWYQVQGIGYWIKGKMVLVSGNYQYQYTLVYAKDNVVNSVQGTHALI